MSQDRNVTVSKDAVLCPKPLPHWYRRLIINFRWTVGLLMFINFMIFWAAPVVIQVYSNYWIFVDHKTFTFLNTVTGSSLETRIEQVHEKNICHR